MALFKKKPSARYDSRNVESRKRLLNALQKGTLPCSECGFQIPLEGLEPLRPGNCPKCGLPNFVPAKVGNFWLVYPAGGGGMGSVYLAYHVEVANRRFAVKLLPREERDNPARVHALIYEAETARRLGQHPCLVTYAASGYADGEYFFAMEYVAGDRLDDLIERHGKLPETFVALLALHLLAAEEHIYKQGFLYRDMKPENVLITPEGRGVLLDYGLCQPIEEARHPTDEFVTGSPYYLPPERLWGTGEDAYSEIYSLGMVLYYALTGQTFFDADEVEALAKKHVSRVRLSVTSRLKGFPPGLVEVLTRMIRQTPEERSQSFAEAAGALYNVYQQLLKQGDGTDLQPDRTSTGTVLPGVS